MIADHEFAELLPLWGLPPDSGIETPDRQGSNNRTCLVRAGRRRYVLRISGFLSAADVRAEHRILRQLRAGGSSPRVPEPVAALDGRTVVETPAGPASLCRWLDGMHPVLDGEAALERYGRGVALLSAALADVPLEEMRRDWRSDPRWVRPDDPPVSALCAELRSAGMGAGQAELLSEAADRAGRWWPGTTRLPAQVIHGDLAPGNVLADPSTGEVTGVLDFELTGAGFRVQDVLAALHNSAALRAADWRRRAAAFFRGCSSVRRLEPVEAAALPELLAARALGSALWRAARWRAGLGTFDDVTVQVSRLKATTRWLTANEKAFVSLATARPA